MRKTVCHGGAGGLSPAVDAGRHRQCQFQRAGRQRVAGADLRRGDRKNYPNALEVTGISGTFSDTNIGIVNASVGPLVPINHDSAGTR